MTLRLALCTDLRRLDERRAAKVDLLMLPELADGGYAALVQGAGTHRPDDEYFRRLAGISRRSGALVVAGSARVPLKGRGAANTSFLFRAGRTLCRYDKIHLFRPTGDHRWFRPGAEARTAAFTVRGTRLRLGVIICFDLRFPELVRDLAFRKIDVLAVPARWPAVRADAWRTLLKARAIENQIFVAGCNAEGKEGGPSFVFDPTGREILPGTRTSAPGWHVYNLDTGALREARRLFDTRGEARYFRARYSRAATV